MSVKTLLPTKEQEVLGFMNRSFFPPWKTLVNTDGLNVLASEYFMGGETNTIKNNLQPPTSQPIIIQPQIIQPQIIQPQSPTSQPIIIQSSTIQPRAQSQTHKSILDTRYWAFWSAWMSFYGIEEYEKIPEDKKLSFWIEEKTKMSDWFQFNFMFAKKEISKQWDRMTNMDMEDAITGLVTDVDEQESGLKTLLLCWTYYSFLQSEKTASEGVSKGAVECIWVVPDKSLYYSFSTANREEEENVKAWGVFVTLLDGAATRKHKHGNGNGNPPKKQKRYEFRALEKGEVESIRNSMIELKAVNRALAAVSKYSLKEMVEMGEKVGLRPPMIHVLDVKGAMKLDLSEKIREAELEAERGLGVVRKSEEKKEEKKDMEKREKWKKGDWYERLEEYCLDVF